MDTRRLFFQHFTRAQSVFLLIGIFLLLKVFHKNAILFSYVSIPMSCESESRFFDVTAEYFSAA